MPKYTVLLQQYVENLARMEVEANSPEDARNIALNRASEALWTAGEDAYDPEVYIVKDENNHEVWNREDV